MGKINPLLAYNDEKNINVLFRRNVLEYYFLHQIYYLPQTGNRIILMFYSFIDSILNQKSNYSRIRRDSLK